MQDRHRQSILSPVPDPPAPDLSEQDAEMAALEELVELCERHLSRLPDASEWKPAFARLELAASRSLGRPPLQLVRHLTG